MICTLWPFVNGVRPASAASPTLIELPEPAGHALAESGHVLDAFVGLGSEHATSERESPSKARSTFSVYRSMTRCRAVPP
jgi:hypothetical protein